ncbi:hypothetical protein ACH5RR_028266 [Cinchona calisaya]|uniref:Replication factor A C-terminal domain-containing protein n=1 Tax=Cinchona calisaya TaxID=153742 RepID=A0ABD2YNA6_9GENT
MVYTCKNCNKVVKVDIDREIRCPFCKENTKVEVKCRIGIMLEDGTSSLHAVKFSPDVEKLIPFTTLQLKDANKNATAAATVNAGVKRYLGFAETNPTPNTRSSSEIAPQTSTTNTKGHPLPLNLAAESPSKKNCDKLKLS